MDIINFGNILLQNVENNLGDGACVKFQEIVKNNGVVYHALVIREEGSNISPSNYIDDFFNMYKAGESFDSITDMVVSLYRESSAGLGLDMDFFRNFDEVKGHLSYKLAMAGPNMDRLRSVPVRAFADLVMIPICILNIKDKEQGSIMITTEHLDMWGISKEELWDSVMRNTVKTFPASVKSINEYLEPDMFDCPELLMNIYVVTTQSGYQGAGAVLYPGVLDELACINDSDLYIIPASVHEMLVVPAKSCSIPPRYLRSMIGEVNSSVVRDEEVLSHSLYSYSYPEGELKICDCGN